MHESGVWVGIMTETRVTFNAVGNETRAGGVTPFDTVAREIERLQDHVTVIAKENANLSLKLAALEKGQDELSDSLACLARDFGTLWLQHKQPDPKDAMERIAETLEAIRGGIERITENQNDVQERSNGVWAVRTVTAG